MGKNKSWEICNNSRNNSQTRLVMNKKIELPRWNWAAFSLNVIWGIGHRCYWPLLCCIPYFGLFWMFVCGFRGNAWAWERGTYDSVEEFENKEFGWTIAGVVATILITLNVINTFFL